MKQRVVITGLGVLAPNGNGLNAFAEALRQGISGIRFQPQLAELGFQCQVAGVPQGLEILRDQYFDASTLVGMDSSCVVGAIAALDAWADAGLERRRDGVVDWDTATVFGFGFGGLDTIGKSLIPLTDAGKVKRLGSSIPERTMGSAVSARIAGLLGLGGQSSAISSACATGSEAIINGYWMLREGRARRVLVGGCESDSPYVWAGFDAMRVLCRTRNDAPATASRPLSASAGGFVPSSGAGALILETLEGAEARGARIYGEIIGASVNCGGQRNGGTMTAGNPEGIRRCIATAVQQAAIDPSTIDLISGHLTATMADPFEIGNWREALNIPDDQFPLINAPKSLVGHTLGAAGALEAVACLLQLHHGFVHPSINCEDLHPALTWCEDKVVRQPLNKEINIVAKSSFGFGDVNTCLIFRRLG